MSVYPWLFKNAILPSFEKLKKKQLLNQYHDYQSHLQWDSEQLAAFQWQQLTALLAHAFEQCDFYKTSWQAAGIENVSDIKSMADFAKLPLVTKDLVREHYDGFVAKNYPNNIKKSTGGSTGQPFHFQLDLNSNSRREAVMWRGYGWMGAGLGTKTLYLWGADLGQPSRFKNLKNALYHGFYNRKMLNSFKMNNDNMHEYIAEYQKYKPTAVVSYVNPLFELAKYMLAKNVKVTPPVSILTGAEPLHDHQREVIEKAFKAPVYNTFGCREFMLIAAECQEHKSLHINQDHLVVETVNEQYESVIEESGDLVITDLHNYGFPLIRYVNGDRATLVKEPCVCGNPLPVMKSIDGRKLDLIETPSGGKIPGELFPHMFKEFAGIDRFQVRQSVIDAIEIVIVKNDQFCEQDEQAITTEVDKYSHGELQINFNFVDEIPLTAAGKHRVTVSELGRG